MKSMTGFGKREAEWKGISFSVEIRSVNHRFCEIITRLPRSLIELEEDLKHLIHRQCDRGRIELAVSVNAKGSLQKFIVLDRSAARTYVKMLKQLQREFRLEGEIHLSLLSGFREIFSVQEPNIETKQAKSVIQRLTKGALVDLNKMRMREGTALFEDMQKRLRTIRKSLRSIERRVPRSVQESFERMQSRVMKLMGDNQFNMDRLHQELATYADRCDITEELTRLKSHLSQFQESGKTQGAIGRRLDFLLQEMGREINTIGSKANDAEIALHVVEVKSELEKIREQVQNVE